MTKTIVYCDRCGEEVIYPIQTRYKVRDKFATIYDNGECSGDYLDLCEKCCNDLEKWVKQSNKIKD